MAPHDKDQLDDLLDGALKRYGEVEPRIGLEGRVLATLAGTDRKPHWWNRWAAGIAIAASVCAVIVVVLMRSPHPRQPVAVHPASTGTDTTVQNVAAPHNSERAAVRHSKPKVAKAFHQRPREFPTRRPLSEQETMLVEYTERYPQDAILAAKEQDEFQKRVEQAEKEIDAGSNSDQQER